MSRSSEVEELGHKEQSIQRSCGRRTRIKTRPVCDCRVGREEDKGDNEAGGQIMPDEGLRFFSEE